MKNICDGGEAILQAFRSLNVDYVISSPGSEWPSLWEALARQNQNGSAGPTFLDCGHETLAVAMATGYTHVTGRMQAVLLHAGAGLLQGAMAVHGAQTTETPMLVMSGETIGYGESEFDPGHQWYRSLSVVGGPQRLLEPVVKWALQSPSIETLYHGVVRAGEVAQRAPRGPTYICTTMEAMMAPWARPETLRAVPAAPKVQPSSSDIAGVANLIAKARCPVLMVENADPDQAVFDHLVTLADLLAIPVVELPAASLACFPKSHDLFVGSDLTPLRDEMDVVLLVECRAPWYPPSNAPNATIVAIGENPLKTFMVHQVTGAGQYLEGDLALTLELLIEALRKIGPEAAAIEQRRKRWTAEHRKWRERLDAAERTAVAGSTITVPLVAKLLREKMPPDTICADETIVHSRLIREHMHWDDPFGYFRVPSGLGQGLGYALGLKLALPKRPVVLTIGDGTFMYNPVVPAIVFADAHAMPLLILICNNTKYAAMQYYHDRFYPSGTAMAAQDYYGVNLPDTKYENAAAIVGGYGKRVETPAELSDALDEAIKALAAGKTAIINMIMPGKVR